jgi:hypothetical protein
MGCRHGACRRAFMETGETRKHEFKALIGNDDKDKFNSSKPKNDATNFADYVTNPTLPA